MRFMTRYKKLTSLVLFGCTFLLAASCATTTDPKARYVAALNHRMEGDSQRYFDTLISLAHEHPDSRYGRKARALITSGGLWSQLVLWSYLPTLAMIPVMFGHFGQLRAEAGDIAVAQQLP